MSDLNNFPVLTKTLEYYDWDDLQPIILKNLNALLAQKGTEPLDNLHGGYFKDGKWVGHGADVEYRNFWHVYVEIFGENLRNDSFQAVYFPHPDDDAEWDYCYELADAKVEEYLKYNILEKTSDPFWARDLVTAVRRMVKEAIPYEDNEDSPRIVIWWGW